MFAEIIDRARSFVTAPLVGKVDLITVMLLTIVVVTVAILWRQILKTITE